MKVRWSHEAFLHLIEIEIFIAKDSPIRAQKFIDQIIKRGDALQDSPHIGRMVPEISNPDIRELIIKNYRLIYKISSEQIEILTVFEGHRLLRVNEI
jgi:addiction module RelE/StbE family toxin